MLKILTLNWNGADKIKKLKDSLLPNLNDIEYEWYIKDNKSSDNSVEEIKSWNLPQVHLIEYPNNLQNFAQGMNYLFDQSKPNDEDLILLLNNDIVFNDNKSLHNMIDLMKYPDVGIVGARLLYTDKNTIQHCGVVFDEYYRAPMHFRCNEISDADAEENRIFQCVTGAVLLIKAKYYKQANKLDENYSWSFEDVDLCLKVYHNLNKRVIYCGKTNIYHEESGTLKKNPINKMFMNHNLNLLRKKWHGKMLYDKEIYTNNKKYNLFQK